MERGRAKAVPACVVFPARGPPHDRAGPGGTRAGRLVVLRRVRRGHVAIGAITTNRPASTPNPSHHISARSSTGNFTCAGRSTSPTAPPSSSHPCSITCAALLATRCVYNQPAIRSRGFAAPANASAPAILPTTADFNNPCISTQRSNSPVRNSRRSARTSPSVLSEKNPPLPLLRRNPMPRIDQRHIPATRSLQQLTPSGLNRPRNKPLRMRLPQRRHRRHRMQHVPHRANPHNQHAPRPVATLPILESVPQATIFSRA